MDIHAVVMVLATSLLGLMVFQWFQGHVMARSNKARRRWEKYKRVQMAVYADGRVCIRRGDDPATDEWRTVLSPETLVAYLCEDERWTVTTITSNMTVATRE